MKPLEPPDSHHVNAAQGWLGLGDPHEATVELEKVGLELRGHPEVLELRWQICAKEQRWQECLELAEVLFTAEPNYPGSWICRAYALRRVPGGGLAAAQICLREGHQRFPQEPIIAYNLACYACQLGDLPEARKWLKRASALGSVSAIKQLALNDADLEPLWAEIAETPTK